MQLLWFLCLCGLMFSSQDLYIPISVPMVILISNLWMSLFLDNKENFFVIVALSCFLTVVIVPFVNRMIYCGLFLKYMWIMIKNNKSCLWFQYCFILFLKEYFWCRNSLYLCNYLVT